MFDKFGEFDSVKEINQKAAELKAAKDEAGLIVLAAENGIDREDAEDYMDDCVGVLASPLMAAVGKLKVEAEELKLKGVLLDWLDELKVMCSENEEFAAAVRKKGKDLAGYIAATAEAGYVNRAVVDRRIVEKTVQVKKILGNHEFAIGIPDKKTRRELAIKHYLG